MQKLAEGTTREVYLNVETGLVHKLQKSCRREYANMNEVLIWEAVKGTSKEKHFLPVLSWDKYKREIVVPFSEDVEAKDLQSQDMIPVYWEDRFLHNLGWYKGRVVIRDYGDMSLTDLHYWGEASRYIWVTDEEADECYSY